MKFKRIIALLADLHVGCRYAVFPEDFVSEEGNNLSATMNDMQVKLLEYFKHYVQVCNDLNVDSVFLVGDLIAGTNPSEQGRLMVTTNLNEQKEACIKLLEPLCKGRKVGVWSGTRYHDSLTYRTEQDIARHFKGKFFGEIANVRLVPSNRVASISHHGHSAIIYPETAFGRDMTFYLESMALGKLPKIDIIIRAHLHRWCYIHRYKIHYVSLPCFQGFVPYPRAVKYFGKLQPDIGGAILFIDEEDRIRVWHYLYPNISVTSNIVEG